MNLTGLCRVELRRLTRQKGFWLIVLLCCCAPFLRVFPMTFFDDILSNKYIAVPMCWSCIAGGILWAILTFLEASRVHRTGTDVLTDAASAPAALPAARMIAQMMLSAGTAVLLMLVWLPYTAYKMDFLFSLKFYLLNYLLLMIPTWWISMLLAESFYQLTRRLEAGVLLYALAVACCALPDAIINYYLRWLCPVIITYSDAFPTYWPLRIGFYSRCIWFAAALALWLISLAAVRKYQRGLFYSFIKGCKNVLLPAGALLFGGCTAFLSITQPFVDHGPAVWTDRTVFAADDSAYYQTVNNRFNIYPRPEDGTLTGTAEYKLVPSIVYKCTTTDYTFRLNPGYKVESLTLNDTPLEFETLHDDNWGSCTTCFSLPEGSEGVLRIVYSGMPTQTHANMPSLVMNTIDPEYISLYGEAFIPNLIGMEITEIGSELYVTLPNNLTPFLEFHPLSDCTDNGDGTSTWYTKMGEPTQWNLLAGDYVTDRFEAGGIDVAFTYGKIYSDTVKEHDLTGAVRSVFDYCTEHYGPISYSDGTTIQLMQTSALITGGWASEGWSTWMEDLVTPEALVNPDKGASAKEVFFHEMIHQWWGAFGLYFTEEDIWSCEGMTVYSTYRLAKEQYGELYAKQYYVDRWKEEVNAQNRNFYNRHPEYLDRLPQFMQDQLRESNKNINWYSRLPLMLLKAEELLGGEEQMDALLQKIYAKREQYLYMGNESDGYSFADFLADSGLTEEAISVD